MSQKLTISSTFNVNTVEDGTSPVFADIDNEMFGVACDADGVVVADVDRVVHVSLWEGSHSIELSSLSASAPQGITATPNTQLKQVRVQIARGTTLEQVSQIDISLSGVCSDGTTATRQLTATVNGVRGGADGSPAVMYELLPSVGSIAKHNDGSYSASVVRCDFQRISGTNVETNPSVPGLSLLVSKDGNAFQSYSPGAVIEPSEFSSSLQFELYVSGTLCDRETVPMVADGESVYVLDLDNENDSMLYGDNGPIGALPVSRWTFYKGGTDISTEVVASALFTKTNCEAEWTDETHRAFRVTSMSASTGKVELSVVKDGKSFKAVMSLKKLDGMDKYDIEVSPNAVSYNSSDEASSSSSTINIRIFRTNEHSGTRRFVSSLSTDGLTLELTPLYANGQPGVMIPITDGTVPGTYTPTGGATRTLVPTTYAQYRIDLYTSVGRVLQDTETVPIIKTKNGDNGRGIMSIARTFAVSAISSTASDDTAPSDILSTSWQASVPSMTEEKPYLWRREITSYTDGQETRYYLQSMRGADGTSPLTIDLDNEIRTIALDQDGKVLRPANVTASYYTFTAKVSLFYGETEQALTVAPSVVAGLPGTGKITLLQSSQGTGILTFAVYYDSLPFGTKDTIILSIQATCQRGSLIVPLTLVGMRNGVMYELSPTANAVVYKKGSSIPTPSGIQCAINKYQNGETIASPSEITMRVMPDNNTSAWQSYSPGDTLIVASFGATKSITFEARKGTLVVDRETIPIVRDGDDGEPAPEKTETRYAWSTSASTASATTEPVLDSGASWQTRIPNRPSSGTYYLWQQVKRWTYNSVIKDYTLQSTTYFRMSGEDAKATQIKGSVVAIMEHSQDWSPATTAAPVGSYAIVLNANQLYKKLGANQWSFQDPPASDGDSYLLSSDGHLWVYVGPPTANVQWVDVGQLQGPAGNSAYVHIAWANAIGPNVSDFRDFTVSKDADENFKFIGFYTDETEDDSTNPLAYSWSEIKGKDAVTFRIVPSMCTMKVDAEGRIRGDIAGNLYRDEAGVTTPVSNATIKIIAGSVIYEYDYTTDGSGFFSTQDSTHSWISGSRWRDYNNFTDLVVRYDIDGVPMAILHIPMIQDGLQGQKGDIGRSYYYKDSWEHFAAQPGASFTVTDWEAPFFSKTSGNSTLYYVFTGPKGTYTPSSAGTPSSSSDKWSVMVTDFKFIIGEAIFTNFAKLGSAVFNKDWMISQYGSTSGILGTDYQTFSPQFPDTSWQALIDSSKSVTATSDAVSGWDVICPVVMKAGTEYSFSVSGRAYSNSSDTMLVALLAPDKQSAVPFVSGAYNLTFNSSSSATRTGAVRPAQAGEYYWIARVQSSARPGTVLAVNMQCDTPFVPTVAVDWLRGYAHFASDKVRFNEEGDGYVAGGNISWDAQGNANVNGIIKAKSFYTVPYAVNSSLTLNPSIANTYVVRYASTLTLFNPENYLGIELQIVIAPPATRVAVNPQLYTPNGCYVITKDNDGVIVQIANFNFDLAWDSVYTLRALPNVVNNPYSQYAWYMSRADLV